MSHTSASPSLRQRSSSPDLHSRPAKLQSVGGFILRYGLVFVLLLWGFAKWTRTEAEVIQPLMAHSPFLSWIYRLMSVQRGSEFIGVVEVLCAALIVTRRWLPRLSAFGSAGCILMFLLTLSFLFTTPNDHRWGFSCCVWSPFACMPSPIPRQDRWKL